MPMHLVSSLLLLLWAHVVIQGFSYLFTGLAVCSTVSSTVSRLMNVNVDGTTMRV